MNILHGFTGSVATILSDRFVQAYVQRKDSWKFVFTYSSQYFMNFLDTIIPEHTMFDDAEEWRQFGNSRTVLHIDLTKWADKFIIAPCSANTLGKIANGLSDNLLTCCARAWDFNKPFVIAPAMNTKMWEHPVTKKHVDELKSWGIIIKDPVEKKLFCGDVGIGAMARIEDILI